MTKTAPPAIDRRELGVRFLQLAAFLTVAPKEAFAQAIKAGDAQPGPYEVVVDHQVMMPMRDGVRLATEIYRPAKDGKPLPGKFPIVLERTPYGRIARSTNRGPNAAQILASHGYVTVFQDKRGRGQSEGKYVKYLTDAADGFDCCAWLVKQPWSNGKIGTMGTSYDAHTQGAAASLGAPGITAMVLDSGAFANAYQDGIRQGGAFELKQVTWAMKQMLEAPNVVGDPQLQAKIKAIDIGDWFKRMPWSRGNSPLSVMPDYEDYVFTQWEHGDFDAFWKQPGIYAEGYYDKWNKAAMIWVSSWYDAYSRSTTDNFVALSKLKKGPTQLIMGPWTHGANARTYSGDIDFGPRSTIAGNLAPDFLTLRMRWFDRHLKGVKNGVDAEPKVRIFVMGGGTGRRNAEGRMDHGGRWRADTAWPPAAMKPTPYYLHGDGGLKPGKPADGAASKTYVYDPRDPVPSIGGTITSGEPLMVGGGFDQREGPKVFGSKQPYRPLAERQDVLVFQTEPLAQDMELTGPVEANLWIASDCPDTDFTIKLIDVYPANADYPEGYALNVTDGIQRCRYRVSWEKPSLMEPGKPYLIKVSAFPTSNLFKKGHRIRLDVSSSNFPHFDLNLNTGAPESKGPEVRVARNTVFLDAAKASHVVLPIVRA